MARIYSYPKTGKLEPNTFLVTDNPSNGTKAMGAVDLANAFLDITLPSIKNDTKEDITGGYTIAVVDELPPVENRDPMTLYFVRKEES